MRIVGYICPECGWKANKAKAKVKAKADDPVSFERIICPHCQQAVCHFEVEDFGSTTKDYPPGADGSPVPD